MDHVLQRDFIFYNKKTKYFLTKIVTENRNTICCFCTSSSKLFIKNSTIFVRPRNIEEKITTTVAPCHKVTSVGL